MKKKRKYDYRPIKLTEPEFRTLMGIEESKKLLRTVEYWLFKWNINTRCKPSDDVGYCFQYRKYWKRWFYVLTWIPVSFCRLIIALWDYGLSNFQPYHRLIVIYEIKNGDEGCNGIFDKERKAEFKRLDEFWNDKAILNNDCEKMEATE